MQREAHGPGRHLRSVSRAETLRRAKGVSRSLGISRVTDITRLDRLGLPVFASVRPRAMLLQVHAGKGESAEDAALGARMEAIELAVAERDARAPADAELSISAMRATWPAGLLPEDFAPTLDAHLDLAVVRPALAVECLGRSDWVVVPAALFRPADGDEGRLFSWSSNGLASGNTRTEATLHALLEVLERDALTMNHANDRSAFVDCEQLPDPLAEYARSWQRQGIELIVRAIPNAIGLPCFAAWLHEPGSADVDFATGSALHPDRRIAAVRAVSEAAQSRLSTLHGARSDVTRFFTTLEAGEPDARGQAQAALLQRLRDRSRSVAFPDVPQWGASSVSQALAAVLHRMAACGLPWVLRRFMDTEDGLLRRHRLSVVKVVVPRCEHIEHHSRRVGPRLRAAILASA